MTFVDRCDNGKHMQMKESATVIMTLSRRLTPPTGPRVCSEKRKTRDKRRRRRADSTRTGVTCCFCYRHSLRALMSLFVIYSIGLFASLSLSLFFMALQWREGQVYMGGIL